MPGELGDETQQPFVGYYERRYQADSEPNLNMDAAKVKSDKPRKSMIQRVLLRTRQKMREIDDAKSKSDAQ